MTVKTSPNLHVVLRHAFHKRLNIYYLLLFVNLFIPYSNPLGVFCCMWENVMIE